jgi:hypothetical protein
MEWARPIPIAATLWVCPETQEPTPTNMAFDASLAYAEANGGSSADVQIYDLRRLEHVAQVLLNGTSVIWQVKWPGRWLRGHQHKYPAILPDYLLSNLELICPQGSSCAIAAWPMTAKQSAPPARVYSDLRPETRGVGRWAVRHTRTRREWPGRLPRPGWFWPAGRAAGGRVSPRSLEHELDDRARQDERGAHHEDCPHGGTGRRTFGELWAAAPASASIRAAGEDSGGQAAIVGCPGSPR